MADLITKDLLAVEILQTGTWMGTGCPVGGCVFTEADLDLLVTNYEATKDSVIPPAKLGHDGNQKLLQTDGYPAAGWLTNIRREGLKLLADIVKVPKVLADLIEVGAYKNRSVEVSRNYNIGGVIYSKVLTGLAFLGEELPAVEGLTDIAALYQSRHLALAAETDVILFSSTQVVAQPTVPKKLHFTLPKGMSYDDLRQSLLIAFCEANPAAEPDDCWVSDIYEDYAIFCLEGRWWQQNYSLNDSQPTVSGIPVEVERRTDWAPVAGMKYVDEADRLLSSVDAFIERTESLANLRAGNGKKMSATNLEKLQGLHVRLSKVLSDSPPTPKPSTSDIRGKMRQSLLNAEAQLTSIQGAEDE